MTHNRYSEPRPNETFGRARRIRRFAETNMTTAKKQTAFTCPLTPSVELAAVIGSAPQPRTEVTKLLWDYIKLNNLQNPANKRNILCDAKLQAVMGKPEMTMSKCRVLLGSTCPKERGRPHAAGSRLTRKNRHLLLPGSYTRRVAA